MPDYTLKIEPISGDKDEIKAMAERFVNKLKESIKASNYQPALDFMTKLETVMSAYVTTIKACDTAYAAQSTLADALEKKQYDQYNSLMDDAINKFNLLHARITAHYGLGHNKVPPVPIDTPPDIVSMMTNTRNKIGGFKTFGDKYYKQCEVINNKVVELKAAVDLEMQKANAGKPTAEEKEPSSPSAPMSSMYGAKQRESQTLAARANQSSSVRLPPINSGTKK